MRIVLRILSIALWVAIIDTLLFIWRFWRFGDFGALLATGPFGLITLFGWVLTLLVGPFAAVQLWRQRESGRMAAFLLAGFNLLYYIVPPLFSRQPSAANPKLWLARGGNALLVLLLLSPSARRACKFPGSQPIASE